MLMLYYAPEAPLLPFYAQRNNLNTKHMNIGLGITIRGYTFGNFSEFLPKTNNYKCQLQLSYSLAFYEHLPK